MPGDIDNKSTTGTLIHAYNMCRISPLVTRLGIFHFGLCSFSTDCWSILASFKLAQPMPQNRNLEGLYSSSSFLSSISVLTMRLLQDSSRPLCFWSLQVPNFKGLY